MRTHHRIFELALALTLGIARGVQAQTITTVAGTGVAGYTSDGVAATSAALNVPVSVLAAPDGTLYIGDQFNHRVRKVATSGIITTIAGTGVPGFSGDGGPATAATINTPTGLCMDAAGNLYISDQFNHRIRRVDKSGIISTYAGNGVGAYSGEGVPAVTGGLVNPIRCAVDAAGNLYISDQNVHRVRKVDASGILTTVAGTGVQGFNGDGPGTSLQLNNPTSVAVDALGNVFFSDQFNQRIRRLDASGNVTTIAGNGTAGFSADGTAAASASLNYPGGMVIDQNGDLYFADDLNFRMRKISGGILTTVAGNGVVGFSGDGGPALLASLNSEFGVTIDAGGNLYFTDSANNRVRKVSGVGAAIAPTYSSTSIGNAASFGVGATPGGLLTVSGKNLSINGNGIVLAGVAPWPTTLAGVSVFVNGAPAGIYGLASLNGVEQVSIQVPYEASGSSITVAVNNGRAPGPSLSVPLLAAQPGLFVYNGSNGAFLHGASNTLITASSPATAGEVVVLYATGLGAVNPPVATNTQAPTTSLVNAVIKPTVTMGGQTATVSFAGLAPGFIGLYQINAAVPAGTTGTVNVIVTANGVTGNTATMAVH